MQIAVSSAAGPRYFLQKQHKQKKKIPQLKEQPIIAQ